MKKIELSLAEKVLVEWFIQTFQDRTPPQRVDEVDPEYRVNYHEVRAKASSLGLEPTEDAVEFRVRFAAIYESHCRKAINRILVANGEKPTRISDGTKQLLKEYGY